MVFSFKVSRLEVVLETKKAKHAPPEGEEDGANLNLAIEDELDNVDLYSDTTSQFSTLSSTAGKVAKTNPLSIQTKASSSRTKSSKNRRKAERKKYSTREGGIHEDIGLIASLHQLISDVYILTIPEVSCLIRALMRIPGQFEKAKSLQALTASLLNQIWDKETSIWCHSDVKRSGFDENTVSYLSF